MFELSIEFNDEIMSGKEILPIKLEVTPDLKEAIMRCFLDIDENGQQVWRPINKARVREFAKVIAQPDGAAPAFANLTDSQMVIFRKRLTKAIEKQKTAWLKGAGSGHLPVIKGQDARGRFNG